MRGLTNLKKINLKTKWIFCMVTIILSYCFWDKGCIDLKQTHLYSL